MGKAEPFYCISRIVGTAPGVKMFGIYTNGIIAPMKDPGAGRDWANKCLVR